MTHEPDDTTSHTANPNPTSEPVRSDLEERLQQLREEDRQRYRQLGLEAQSVFRATQGWPSIGTPEEWRTTCIEARAGYDNGGFLMEQLGAERFLSPQETALLWSLRQSLVKEMDASTTAETMLIDLAILSYANALRAQRWSFDLSLVIESEFFGQSGPRAKLTDRHGREMVRGFKVEEDLRRLREDLMPLFDRANRGVIRNLTAIRDLKRGSPCIVAVGRADQVNVAEKQVNVSGVAANEDSPKKGR